MATTTTEDTMPELLLPVKDRSMGGTRLSPTAIADAIDFLEIQDPVEIKWSSGWHRRGAHRYRDGRHVITLSTHLVPAQASETLWHELTHAVQQERFDSRADFNAAYRLQGRTGYRYDTNRFEIEAREVAAAYATEFPLTR